MRIFWNLTGEHIKNHYIQMAINLIGKCKHYIPILAFQPSIFITIQLSFVFNQRLSRGFTRVLFPFRVSILNICSRTTSPLPYGFRLYTYIRENFPLPRALYKAKDLQHLLMQLSSVAYIISAEQALQLANLFLASKKFSDVLRF